MLHLLIEFELEDKGQNTYDWGVAGVIGVVQEPVVFGFCDCLDLFEVAVGNSVAH